MAELFGSSAAGYGSFTTVLKIAAVGVHKYLAGRAANKTLNVSNKHAVQQSSTLFNKYLQRIGGQTNRSI
jgi:hypothetical protein